MSDLYPTKTRMELLRAVRDGAVYREWGNDYLRSDDSRKVNARVAEQARVGWVQLPRPGVGTVRKANWQLTAEGERVLAEHEGGAR